MILVHHLDESGSQSILCLLEELQLPSRWFNQFWRLSKQSTSCDSELNQLTSLEARQDRPPLPKRDAS
jgi:hypothetical protein